MAYDFINPTSAEDQHLSTTFQPPSGASLRTIACFFNCTALGSGGKIFGYGGTNVGTGFGFAYEEISSSPFVVYRHNGGSIRFPSSGTNVQQHLATVVPSGATTTNDVLVYIDGALVTGTRNSGSNQTLNTGTIYPFFIGKTGVDVGIFLAAFNGKVSEVGVWDVALTATEIASLSKGITCDRVRLQSLGFYAPLIRNLQDVRGGVTITNNNGATVANHPRVYR